MVLIKINAEKIVNDQKSCKPVKRYFDVKREFLLNLFDLYQLYRMFLNKPCDFNTHDVFQCHSLMLRQTKACASV